MALAMAFLAAENENRQLEDLPQAAFLKRFLLSVRKKSINENFVNESYARCYFAMIQRTFYVEPYRQRTL